jgi:hypothetical protein
MRYVVCLFFWLWGLPVSEFEERIPSPFAPSGSDSLNFKLSIESGTPSQPLQDILL